MAAGGRIPWDWQNAFVELQGKLLVASPALLDPNFFRSVVFVCDHDEQGTLGVILNRPTDMAVVDHLAGWQHLLGRPEVIFEGGPVERAAGVGLGVGRAAGPGWTQITGSVGLVDLTADPTSLDTVTQVRVFSGYAGWAPGQAEAEIEEGAWFVLESDTDDVFTADPADLWHRVLRRQSGRLAMFALFPDDPTLN